MTTLPNFLVHSFKPETAPSNSKAAKFAKFGGADRCPRCSKAVYAAEKVIGAGKVRASWVGG